MRPYKRKSFRGLRTRGNVGIIHCIYQYLKPFLYNLKVLWNLDPPFPISGKITITFLTWILLMLPLIYFLVPPIATIFFINYFSGRWTCDEFFMKIGQICACTVDAYKLRGKTVQFWKIFDRIAVALFIYDYFQLIRYFRDI